jgi:hypothetical protein
MKGIFSLNNPIDLLRKLEHDFGSMQRDPTNQYAAFNFFVTAEHMLDWLYPGNKCKEERKRIRASEILLQVTSHLASGAKHFQVEAPHHKSVVQTGQNGYFAPGYFQEGYFSEWLFIELTDEAADQLGKSIRLEDLAKRVLEFWRNHLSNV